MKERPIWVLMAGAVLIGIVIMAVASGRGPGPNGGQSPSGTPDPRAAAPTVTPPSGAIKIGIASSSVKQAWLHAAADKFNRNSGTEKDLQVNGKPVFVEMVQETVDGKKQDYRSGTMVSDTLDGKIKPTVLSPAEDSWIARLNKEWQGLNGKAISTGDPLPLARTPIVLAMWQSRARALGCWPAAGPQCTWETIRTLATSPNGWEMFGQPAWGRFKLGYGYVGESNSGTLSVAIMCMIGAGKTSGLILSDVDAATGCGATIAAIEKAKFHSGKQSAWLFDRMATGPEYLDAVITNESEMIQFNLAQGSGLREPVVAVYPQDGTVVASHPYAILDRAPWVSADQVEAAKVFRKFLLSREEQEAVLTLGLRPADPAARPGPPIEAANGADPQARIVTLALPDAPVMDRITEVWHKVKKHSQIALVFDKSGSMGGEKIKAAVAGAREFITRMDGEDWLMWMPFDDRVYTGARGQKSEVGETLLSDISSTTAGGNTALYDAVLMAFESLEAQRKTYGDSVRYGLVILSDGKDTGSKKGLTMLEERLRPSENDPAGVQIHTIAIGNDADEGVLKKIANSAHGKFWKGQTQKDMVNIYKEIAAYY